MIKIWSYNIEERIGFDYECEFESEIWSWILILSMRKDWLIDKTYAKFKNFRWSCVGVTLRDDRERDDQISFPFDMVVDLA
jgi:hypothetical protein